MPQLGAFVGDDFVENVHPRLPARPQLFERLDANVAVVDYAIRIVCLKSEGAAAEFTTGHRLEMRSIRHLGPAGGDFAVDLDGDLFALDANLVVKPLAVLGWGGVDVFHGVEATGLFRVAMGIVHLRLKSGVRPPGVLILGVEVDAGVGLGEGFNLRPENEVLEVMIRDVTGVKQVSAWAVDDDVAILNRNRLGVFLVDPPALERLAVKQADEALLALLFALGLFCVDCHERDHQ